MTAHIDNIKIEGTPDEIIAFLNAYKETSTDVDIKIKGWKIQDNVMYGDYCGRCLSKPCRCKSGIDTDGAFIPDHMYFKT